MYWVLHICQAVLALCVYYLIHSYCIGEDSETRSLEIEPKSFGLQSLCLYTQFIWQIVLGLSVRPFMPLFIMLIKHVS